MDTETSAPTPEATATPVVDTAPLETSIDGTPVGDQSTQVVQEANWIDAFSDEDKGKIQNKGYKTPQDLWKAYASLNSHMGADEKNLLRMPNEGEPMDEVHMRLGRPKTIEEYEFTPREGFEGGERLNAIRDIAFKGGMSGDTYKSLIDEFVDGEIKQIQQAEQQIVDTRNSEIASMKAEWGVDYDKKINNASNAARAMGIKEDVRDAIRDSIGLRASTDLFGEIYKLTGEDAISRINGVVSGEKTVEQMQVEIQEIQRELGSDRSKKNEFFNKGKNYQRFQELQNTISKLESLQ